MGTPAPHRALGPWETPLGGFRALRAVSPFGMLKFPCAGCGEMPVITIIIIIITIQATNTTCVFTESAILQDLADSGIMPLSCCERISAPGIAVSWRLPDRDAPCSRHIPVAGRSWPKSHCSTLSRGCTHCSASHVALALPKQPDSVLIGYSAVRRFPLGLSHLCLCQPVSIVFSRIISALHQGKGKAGLTAAFLVPSKRVSAAATPQTTPWKPLAATAFSRHDCCQLPARNTTFNPKPA